MSTILIQISDKELTRIIENAMLQGAKIAIAEISKEKSDKISEAEATKEFGYNKRKLATLRASESITYFADQKPFSYSRRSLEEYVNSTKVAAKT